MKGCSGCSSLTKEGMSSTGATIDESWKAGNSDNPSLWTSTKAISKECWKKGCCGYPSINRKWMSSAGTTINGNWTAGNSGDSNLWSWSPGSNGCPIMLLGANVPTEAMCHGSYNAGNVFSNIIEKWAKSPTAALYHCALCTLDLWKLMPHLTCSAVESEQ